MNEMPNEIGLSYLEFISKKAKLFFTKNTIGKYSPNDIDLEITNQSQFDSALEMGLIKERIKMFDSFGRKDAVKLYHKRFCPDKFSLLKTQRGFGQYVLYELSLFGK